MTENELRALIAIAGGKPSTLLGHYYVAANNALTQYFIRHVQSCIPPTAGYPISHSDDGIRDVVTAFLVGSHHKIRPPTLRLCYIELARFLNEDLTVFETYYAAIGLPPEPPL